MKRINYLVMLLMMAFFSIGFVACSSDEENLSNKEHDAHLYGEWVESSGNIYVFDYYSFYSDGTGIHGSYEPNIDLVNEDDDINWYTENNKYLYMNGYKYEYSCDGTSLEITRNGRTRHYHEK